VQVRGFDWKNCGQPDVPAVLKTLTLSPDPIAIPGDLTASATGSTSVELAAPLSVSKFQLLLMISYIPAQRTSGRQVVPVVLLIREGSVCSVSFSYLILTR